MVEYPIFDVPLLGGSLLIAAVAIFHVFVSHFSVGAGFFMAIAERRAIKDNDDDTLSFLKKYVFLVLLVPYVFGTVSGVGIWFTIALVNPRAVSILIHQFVWDWAIEWVLFIVEVVSIFVYVFRWDKMSAKAHNRLGWIFAFCSLATLFVINGILSFMLTPGQWQPFDAGVLNYKALLNPTYLPTSLGRVTVSLALAGVGAVVLMTFIRKPSEHVHKRIIALAYKFMLPAILCVPLGGWIFTQLSQRAQSFLMGAAAPMVLFLGFGMVCFMILFFAALVSLIRKDYNTSSLGAILLCLLAFVSFGSMEFVREGTRKPYVIEGFMYSTGVTVPAYKNLDHSSNLMHTNQAGILSAAPWAVPAGVSTTEIDDLTLGQAVFNASCVRCHSVDGYNAVRPLVKGWSAQTLRQSLDHLDEIKTSMPPFPGTDEEKEALTIYLRSLQD
jgi:cytochrome bd-type quinol oxidase subunit 1